MIVCMKKIFLISLIIVLSALCKCQTVEYSIDFGSVSADSIYYFDDNFELPQFPGGNDSLISFIKNNITYPVEARNCSILGKVYVRFEVIEDGSVNNVSVIEPIDPHLDKEAIRVIKLMPKWKCGTQRGKPIKTTIVIPVYFSLN